MSSSSSALPETPASVSYASATRAARKYVVSTSSRPPSEKPLAPSLDASVREVADLDLRRSVDAHAALVARDRDRGARDRDGPWRVERFGGDRAVDLLARALDHEGRLARFALADERGVALGVVGLDDPSRDQADRGIEARRLNRDRREALHLEVGHVREQRRGVDHARVARAGHATHRHRDRLVERLPLRVGLQDVHPERSELGGALDRAVGRELLAHEAKGAETPVEIRLRRGHVAASVGVRPGKRVRDRSVVGSQEHTHLAAPAGVRLVGDAHVREVLAA